MGRYAVWSNEVIDRYPRVTTDSRAVGTVESAYLIPAEAEVDARLGARFTIPFSNNNLTVKDLVIDLTIIRVGTYRDKDDTVQKRVDAKIKALLDGTMVMVTASGEVAAYPLSGVINTTASYHPTFGMGDILDQRVDQDRIDDEEDARG